MFEYVNKIKLDLTYYSGENRYSDGDIEDEILEMVKNTDEADYNSLLLKTIGGRCYIIYLKIEKIL